MNIVSRAGLPWLIGKVKVVHLESECVEVPTDKLESCAGLLDWHSLVIDVSVSQSPGFSGYGEYAHDQHCFMPFTSLSDLFCMCYAHCEKQGK